MDEGILNQYKISKRLIEGYLSKDLVINDGVFSHWIENTDLFWYRHDTSQGKEYRLVDALSAKTSVAFDHCALAYALSLESELNVDAQDLPIDLLNITLSPRKIEFNAFGEHWIFDVSNVVCTRSNCSQDSSLVGELISPDKKHVIFVRDYNLWVRDLSNGQELALTSKGTVDFPYATAANSYGNPAQIQAIWSPDSRRVLTHQLDLQGVRVRRHLFPVTGDNKIDSEFVEDKAASAGDEIDESYKLLAIEIKTGSEVSADYHQIPLCRGSNGYFCGVLADHLGCWNHDSNIAYFVDIERGAKSIRFVEFDTDTGETRVLFDESSETFVKLSHTLEARALMRALPETDELVWFSERDGWGHLYLYDLKTGLLKNRITQGRWVIRDILHIDLIRRELVVQTSGRNPGINPYYQDICLVSIDSGEIAPLITGPYEHIVFMPDSIQTLLRSNYEWDTANANGVAPSGNYFVVTRSRVNTLPESLLIDREGNVVMTLETAQDVGLPTNWCWPEPVKVKATDGNTDIYGVLYRPPGFSKDKKYPILDYTLAVTTPSLLPQGSFINDTHCGDSYLMGAAYAALGFIVVGFDVPGMPLRDKAFHEQCYGGMRCINAFDDRISGFKQLAKIYPYMDLERVGIIGCDHVNGAVYGLLEKPDFYKVGVNVAFNDSRFCKASKIEMFEGVQVAKKPYTNALLANLRGKLLLIHGMRDRVVPVEATLHLIDALIKAGKHVDVLIEPQGIDIVSSYALRKTWDYLVKHLLRVSPPESFEVTIAFDRMAQRKSSKR